MARTLVVKATAGADAPERCAQAFTVAATAVASGVDVSLWLTGESTWFALPGRAAEFELPHSAPLPDLLRRRPRRRTGHRLHPVRRPPRHHARPTCCPGSASPAPRCSSRRSWPTASRRSSTDAGNRLPSRVGNQCAASDEPRRRRRAAPAPRRSRRRRRAAAPDRSAGRAATAPVAAAPAGPAAPLPHPEAR